MVPIESPGNASVASDERQLRISAFKNKVATLRATSKVYNITSDRSINTLDSSLASSAASSQRGRGGQQQQHPSLLGSPYNSPGARSAEKRSPYQETNPFADSDDERYNNNTRSAVAPMTPGSTTSQAKNSLTLSYERPLNPFLDSDSEVSSGEDITVDSSEEEEEEGSKRSEVSTDGDLFADMVKAFRKVKKPVASPPVVTPEKHVYEDESDEDDDEGYSTASEEEQKYDEETCSPRLTEEEVATIQPMSLEQKIGNTGTSSFTPPQTSNSNSNRPALITQRGTSHGTSSSKYSHRSSTSVAANSKASSQTFSTMDGFSIESVHESSINDSTISEGSRISTPDISQRAKSVVSRASSAKTNEQDGSSILQSNTNPFVEDDSSHDGSSINTADLAEKSEMAIERAEESASRASSTFKSSASPNSKSTGDGKGESMKKEDAAVHNQLPESAPLLRGWSSIPNEVKPESQPKLAAKKKDDNISTNPFADDEASNDDSIEQAAKKSAASLMHELTNNGNDTAVSDDSDDDYDSESTASTPKKQTSLGPSNNPFAELLSLRQRRKRMEMQLRLASKRSVGSVNLDSSSDGASASMSSSSSVKQSSSNNSGITSLDGVLFSDLKKTLSKIQSVSLEEEESGHEEKKDDERRVLEEDKSNHGRPADMQSQLVYKKGSESCGVSSLKDVSHFNEDSESDYENPFLDDDDDETTTVMSVPKSPAPLMVASSAQKKVTHLLGQQNSASEEEESIVEENGTFETISASAEESIKKLCQDNKGVHNVDESADDNETVTCSNSQRVDLQNSTRTARGNESNITPPKTHVVLPSSNETNGSISTKDSIVGRTIAIGNGDLAAERIYLESLRAQVLAELKVHVADEEIRLALDARLVAIQDYYKRKATAVVLKPPNNGNTVADTLNRAAAHRDNSLPELPQVKPTVIHQSKSIEEQVPLSPGSDPSNVIPFPDPQRENPHKFAFERVQGQMNAAIQAVHSASPTRSGSNDDDQEKRDEQNAEGHGAVAYNRQQTETPIPMHIFTKDTFWDEDEPSTIPTTPMGNCSRHENIFPPSHGETIQNAWSFYRTVNGLIFDSRVYDYEFALLQEDPLYPYLNSLVGIADSGEDGFANEFKRISQPVKRDYANKSPHRICHSLAREAEVVMPELKAVCAYIGNKLGMQTMAVGPVKKPSEALLKCEKKYGGDPLLVTDYCRASLFVKDISNLLALIEIVLSKYASIVRRIKLSSLKADHVPLIGGYRDVKINLDIDGHICEIQVHLVPLWLLKERGGYAHYKECCEHNVDVSSFDVGKTLRGLGRDTLADLIKMAEHSVKRMPIENLKQYNEDQIRDYFALANLYLSYGMPVKAETILRRIIKLRSECQSFGPYHAETLLHMERLRKCLKVQHKYKSASSVKSQISKAKKMQQESTGERQEPELSELCHHDQCGAIDYVCDMILDPSKKERLEEKRKADAVDESRALWLRVRRSYFN